jgi:predicted nucleotidyltransferase
VNVTDEANRRLDAVEAERGVRVLYACESGSRAWGFASTDSDYDVRFLYVGTRDSYLAIDLERRRDVIELPLDGVWDVNGWDLRKALRLFRKSNPPLLEWLGSPIVYRERTSVPARLRALLATFYSPRACRHHYLHMARGNYREHLRGETVRLKKYLYVLRPLLAVRWIDGGLGIVPTEFGKLVEAVAGDGEIRREIDRLLVAKRAGEELSRGPRIDALSRFIEEELARHDAAPPELPVPSSPVEPLNALFREALAEAWRGQG